MRNEPIITIAGRPGSGTTSTAKTVAKRLGYECISSGGIFREIAVRMKMSVEELNLHAETTDEIDREVDSIIESYRGKSRIVFDSRTAYHWIPDSFKVCLVIDERTAAERIFADIAANGRVGQDASSVEEVLASNSLRVRSERDRYKRMYGIETSDYSQFNLFFDTGENDLDFVVSAILRHYGQLI